MAVTTTADNASPDQMSLMLRYSGPSVTNGRMDVYEVAANMAAFSDYVIVAAHKTYGDAIEVKAEVTAFSHGSFETDLLFHVAGAAAAIWTATPDMAGLITAVKESLGLYRFLQGSPPASVQHVDNRSVSVTNNNGQMTVVQIESLNVALDPRAGLAAETFVGRALSRPGIEQVDVSAAVGALVGVARDEAGFYKRLEAEEVLTETVMPMALVVEMPGFRDGLKWRFWDGEKTFAASIEDRAFLARVDAGEAFRKGDTLICDVRIVQSRTTAGGLQFERTVVQVHRHAARPDQPDLPLDAV